MITLSGRRRINEKNKRTEKTPFPRRQGKKSGVEEIAKRERVQNSDREKREREREGAGMRACSELRFKDLKPDSLRLRWRVGPVGGGELF